LHQLIDRQVGAEIHDVNFTNLASD
jgi:hypothetical protein